MTDDRMALKALIEQASDRELLAGMLGFVAEATSTAIELNDGELEDARWFTREELLAGACKLPFRISIARRLVDHWIDLAGRG